MNQDQLDDGGSAEGSRKDRGRVTLDMEPLVGLWEPKLPSVPRAVGPTASQAAENLPEVVLSRPSRTVTTPDGRFRRGVPDAS